MNIEMRVIDIIRRYAENGDDVTIERSHKLRDDLGLDSIDLCELWMDLEKEFNADVPEWLVEELTDVESVITAVEQVLNAFDNGK